MKEHKYCRDCRDGVVLWCGAGAPAPLPLTLTSGSTLGPDRAALVLKDLVIPRPAAGGQGTCCLPPASQPMWRQPPSAVSGAKRRKAATKGGKHPPRKASNSIPEGRHRVCSCGADTPVRVFPRERKAKAPEPASDDACHPEARALRGPKDLCNLPIATMVHALAHPVDSQGPPTALRSCQGGH